MKFHKDKAGHWLPIIVQGDPRKPRAKPSVSVMDIVAPSSVDRVKKNALLGAGGAGLRIEEAASPVNRIRLLFLEAAAADPLHHHQPKQPMITITMTVLLLVLFLLPRLWSMKVQ